jgi:DNA polymerase III sliding clamp (beta) subunit (PCNA family)
VKFTANAGELAAALALAATLGEDKRIRNLRNLEAIDLATDTATVRIGGNVLNHAVSLAVPADVEEPGALAVSGQRLAALAAGFSKDAKIQIGDDGAAARVICGRSRFQAVTVEHAALVQALERVKAVADPAVRAKPLCGLAWQDNELRLCLAGHPDAADDVIDAAVDGAGRTAAQIGHLVELLESLNGKRVRIDAADALAPMLVTDPDDADFLAVQMPCRVPFETSRAA